METPPDNTKPVLDRKDVLDAIDNEIARRESVLSRHGFSTWGIIAAICALWAAVSDSLSAKHNWPSVVLVMLAGGWGLALFSSQWLKALGIGNLSGARNIRELAAKSGVQPATIPQAVLHNSIIVAAGFYAGLNGFFLLAVTTVVLHCLATALLVLGWLVFQIQIPVRIPASSRKPKRELRAALLTKTLSLCLFLVPLNALISVWPLDLPDVRLGLMLSALSALWAISINFIHPPTITNGLHDLRSRLAFGEIGAEEAKSKAIWILNGSSDERFLGAKADEIEAELKEYIRLSDSICDKSNRIEQLADRLREGNPSKSQLEEIAAEFRLLHREMTKEMREMAECMETASRLRSQLGKRVKVAKYVLGIEADTCKAVIKQVDGFGADAEKARQNFLERAEKLKAALSLLYAAQRDIKLPPLLKVSEFIDVCFRP